MLTVIESNASLKLKFQKLHGTIVESVNPASIINFLFQEDVIDDKVMRRLQRFSDDPQEQCEELLTLLHASQNQQAFIRLYAAIKHESNLQWLVDHIDNLHIVEPGTGTSTVSVCFLRHAQ